jgi:hypothetical protein
MIDDICSMYKKELNNAFELGYNKAQTYFVRVIKCVRANERVRELKSNNVIRLSKVKAYGYIEGKIYTQAGAQTKVLSFSEIRRLLTEETIPVI